MQLEEKLQICLLALTSRYPDHIVHVNKALIGPLPVAAYSSVSSEIIRILRDAAPEVLEAPARLEVDAQKSEIYLLEHSEDIPAFYVRYKERIPTKTHYVEQDPPKALR